MPANGRWDLTWRFKGELFAESSAANQTNYCNLHNGKGPKVFGRNVIASKQKRNI
jgi:hypothetical protein